MSTPPFRAFLIAGQGSVHIIITAMHDMHGPGVTFVYSMTG